jgi:hypothetical protein
VSGEKSSFFSEVKASGALVEIPTAEDFPFTDNLSSLFSGLHPIKINTRTTGKIDFRIMDVAFLPKFIL